MTGKHSPDEWREAFDRGVPNGTPGGASRIVDDSLAATQFLTEELRLLRQAPASYQAQLKAHLIARLATARPKPWWQRLGSGKVGRPLFTSIRWLANGTAVLLLGVVLISVVVLTVMAASSLSRDPRQTSSGAFSAASASPSAATASPIPSPTPTLSPGGAPTALPANQGRVANTEGAGVPLRSQPGWSSASITRIAEGATITLLGPKIESEGTVWRHIADENGNEGWVAAQFLFVPSESPKPMPSPTPTSAAGLVR